MGIGGSSAVRLMMAAVTKAEPMRPAATPALCLTEADDDPVPKKLGSHFRPLAGAGDFIWVRFTKTSDLLRRFNRRMAAKVGLDEALEVRQSLPYLLEIRALSHVGR